MWRALTGLGFTGGTVLEPGSGAGTFIGLAPDRAQMTGVELDPLTAAISRALYPHATVRAESFADTRLPEGHFDAAIGNVPFSSVTLHDPVHNPTKQSMHNHFIIKSLRLTRPGGLIAVLTSHFTMDAQNPGARREMNELADLVGVIRLPTGAHRRAAGTEVLTDLLLFRRRPDGEPIRDDLWETVRQVPIDGVPLRINAWFDEHPEGVIGDVGVGHGMYETDTLTVTADLARLEDQLATAVDQLVFRGRREGLTMTERTPAQTARRAAFIPSPPELWEGSLVATDTGFASVLAGGLEPYAVPKSATGELRALLHLRDAASKLLTVEASTLTTPRRCLRPGSR